VGTIYFIRFNDLPQLAKRKGAAAVGERAWLAKPERTSRRSNLLLYLRLLVVFWRWPSGNKF